MACTMPTWRRRRCRRTVFLAALAQTHVRVDAFAPATSPSVAAVARCTDAARSRRDAPSADLPRHSSQMHRQSTSLHFQIEDAIFNAQSAGSSLANTVISSGPGAPASSLESLKSIPVLYAAGLVTSFSPCSLGLLPITVSYITNAANERSDKNTLLPTLSFAAGLALVFTALGVSASALGGVFGGSSGSGNDTVASLLLAAVSSLVSVFMGLQLLELIRIPLPSLGSKWRAAAAFETSGANSSGGSLFDENGGLVLGNLQSNQEETGNGNGAMEEENSDELSALLRICLLGGTSALVASPCATPVLASLLAYLASASSDVASSGDLGKGASWMLSYTIGYSTPLLAVGATGGQALVNLQKMRGDNEGGFSLGTFLGQWVTPISGGVLIAFGMNGFLVALLGDPSLSGLAPILE